MSTSTGQSMPDDLAPVGWERRPSDGATFAPEKRHLYVCVASLDEVSALRTLCGTQVPHEVLREMRAGRAARRAFSAAVCLLDDNDLAAAPACKRCATKQARR